jgi:SPP1 family predicted phage head-tail adaptor
MRAGSMRHLLTLQSETTADDGSGGQTVAWSDVDDVWCDKQELSGREFLQAGVLQNAPTHRVRLRYRTDVTAKSRFYSVDEVKTYEVVSPPRDVDGRKRELEIDIAPVPVTAA